MQIFKGGLWKAGGDDLEAFTSTNTKYCRADQWLNNTNLIRSAIHSNHSPKKKKIIQRNTRKVENYE